MYSLILFVCAISCVKASLAPFITPCRAADTNCLKAQAQKAVPILAAGIPNLGITVMDPMKISSISASQAGLNMDFKNTVVRGLRNCAVLNLKRQGSRTTIEMKCSVTLIGDYKLGGKLLMLPINGQGKYKIKIRDIVVKIQFDVGEKTANGQKYWTVNSWKHNADVLTNVEFQFQNLFDGDKGLSDSIHKFANENWKDIFHEVAPPIVKSIIAKTVDETRKFFDRVPIKDLALD